MAEQPPNTVKLTIDGREVVVPKGTLLVEAAKQAKIDIPVFCYHPKLAPAGACRMCLVQIEKMPRLQTACTTPVAEGMLVHTQSDEVKAAQRGVVEMLLTNHPLDCPVCDKGGECPLQDITFAYGPGVSRFYEPKRHFRKPILLSDTIVLDRERCIMCYRCVRFQREVAGDESLTVIDRGSYSAIAVMPGRTFDSPFSGNTIELCPVGALTSRLFRFTARCWDLTNVPSVCSMCSVGCNVWVGVRDWSVKRITARENTPVDDGWLCDRGRFTYTFVNSAERLQQPLVRRDGQLQPATWDEALRIAARGLADAGSAAAGLSSVQWTNEELYLFQKLFRVALGSNSVDHAPRQPLPAATPFGYDALAGSIAALESAQSIVLVGANPLIHQPVLDLRLKKAKRRGATLVVIASERLDLVDAAAAWFACPPGGERRALLALLKALAGQKGVALAAPDLAAALAALDGAAVPEAAVAALAATAPGRGALLYRRDLAAGPEGAAFVASVRALADLLGLTPASGAPVGALVRGANEQGALDLGLHPTLLPGQRPAGDAAARADLAALWGASPPTGGVAAEGLPAAIADGSVRALFLAGVDPSADAGWGPALDHVRFLVVADIFLTPAAQRADVVLPGASFAERDGTFTSLERRVQRVRPGFAPPGQARPDWQTLVALANELGHAWRYRGPADVLHELTAAVPLYRGLTVERLGDQGVQWPWPLAAEAAGETGRQTGPARGDIGEG